ncbi:ATP-binding protein [Streptomyces sp. P1-3]|uniref:ATP-binding protein n=1 Tax=Streptomyces sp. P1-3 TaxID=3421658 RepID=UPI003D365413
MEVRQLSFSVPSTTRDASEARRRAVAEITGWGLRPGSEALNAAELVTAELLANAVRHAGPEPVSLGLRLQDSVLRIEVRDSSSKLPRPRLPASEKENGRGLFIVAALATRHAVEPTPTGKQCWADIQLPPDESPDQASPCPQPTGHVPLPRR